MDSTATGLEFAVIGHQDSWPNITDFINGIRTEEQKKLTPGKIKDIFSFIPPRAIFQLKVQSLTGAEVKGVYFETFIDPDKLAPEFNHSNITKVVSAMSCAKAAQVKIVTMGGFTSIVLDGDLDPYSADDIKFTTGNTLTSAYIVKGVEKAAEEKGIDITSANVLILGATGDIGLACVHYLKHKVQKLLLCARNMERLEKLAGDLLAEDIQVSHTTHMNDLVKEADIIICVASSAGLKLEGCKKNVLICDAGYPKNIEAKINPTEGYHLFHGGMGLITQGFHMNPDYSKHFYRYAAPYIGHGCILEAIVLAFEKRLEAYSTGRGNIHVEKMEEIYAMSLKHGITLAPFYNAEGLWKHEPELQSIH